MLLSDTHLSDAERTKRLAEIRRKMKEDTLKVPREGNRLRSARNQPEVTARIHVKKSTVTKRKEVVQRNKEAAQRVRTTQFASYILF